jgi:hypothetical protein
MSTSSSHRKQFVATIALFAVMSMGAQARGISEASAQMSEASAASVTMTASAIVTGSLAVFQASGNAVVASVQTVGEGSVVVLTGASEVGSAVIRIAGKTAEQTGLLVGGVVMISAVTTGYVLRSAGQIVAFVPDTVGMALLHSARVAGDR